MLSRVYRVLRTKDSTIPHDDVRHAVLRSPERDLGQIRKLRESFLMDERESVRIRAIPDLNI